MSADVLRRAARLLRERAEAATDGPWQEVENDLDDWMVVTPLQPGSQEISGAGLPEGDAAYIALVDPTVGAALADWLEVVAAWQDEGLGTTHGIENTNYPSAVADQLAHALTTARALLREEAPDER